ncbi:hypothetical protein DSO57_1034228 [Entomophthora muscae]|uniref:Uncharacterized protein n=1 Tax=Entomophthora muscae TaxID=34485 RepID=A0ACC2TAY9_9FUNG|nr:hypothetical protein DSO57_1034228 [Entomophthora muscae]
MAPKSIHCANNHQFLIHQSEIPRKIPRKMKQPKQPSVVAFSATLFNPEPPLLEK